MARQKRGRFSGIPDRLGKVLAASDPCLARKKLCWPLTVERASSPSLARPATFHRSFLSGGSLITISPPTVSSGAAHSAVGLGPANPRAITTSYTPRCSLIRPASSARQHKTWTRASRPSSRTASCRIVIRFRLLSRNNHEEVGRARARTNPGRPPPAPRSTILHWSIASSNCRAAERKPRAWVRWTSHGPGPRNPNARACSRNGIAFSALVISSLETKSSTKGLDHISGAPNSRVPRGTSLALRCSPDLSLAGGRICLAAGGRVRVGSRSIDRGDQPPAWLSSFPNARAACSPTKADMRPMGSTCDTGG